MTLIKLNLIEIEELSGRKNVLDFDLDTDSRKEGIFTGLPFLRFTSL